LSYLASSDNQYSSGGFGNRDTGNQIHFQNVELIRIINDLKKKDTQIEASKKLDQYMHQYQEDCDDNLFN